MAKLGSRNRPAIVRVQTQKRAEEIFNICVENGWQVIVGIEPEEQENISDVERLLNPPEPFLAHFKRGRNDECYCGSGKKYKKCCLEE
jgi:SWIM/SEC-C metal-binding protein